MIRFFAPAMLLLPLSSPAALAHDTTLAPTLECHSNDLHYVIGVPAAAGGTSYRIGDFAAPDSVNPCTLDAAYTRQFAAADGNALYFQAIADDLLVLTESTGPEYFLEIYDVSRPDVLLKVDAQDIEVSELGVHYYEPGAAATVETCPRYAELTAGGMGAIIGQERFYPFSTGEVVPGKGTRCYQTP